MTNLYKIKVPEGKKRLDIIEALTKIPEVLYAEPNGKFIHHAIPSDTRFGDQWGLRNTIWPGADIHAEAAWDIYQGNANNIIAIVDGGTQTLHVDLNDKITGGDAGFGWGDHGTHVSGIAAAESNNTQGISGVDWFALIHPQRVDNVTDDAGTYQAIIDAVNFSPNVHVLNNSWGMTDEDENSGRYSTTVRQAFAYVYKANRTSVVSMGNHQLSQPGVVGYPAGFGNVIAVGATNNTDGIANFSAQGNHIDVCAPGVDILSTINDGYGFMSGTSMAAPHVSGIASLLKGFNSNLANDDIENIIKLSADDRGATGFDSIFGFGRVNAERALNLLRAPNTVSQCSATSGTTVTSSGQFQMVFLGAPGLASSAYIVKRHEVIKTINYPTQYLLIEGVWGRGVFTDGWNQENPNFGEGFCEVVPGTQTNSSVTFRTYVFQVWSLSGSYLGYYPKSPSNVTFAYTVLGVPAPTLSGPSIVCSSGATFTINGNLPAGASINWTYSSNLQIQSSGSNYINLKSNSSGNGWVQAKINSVFGEYDLPLKYVWAGIPLNPTNITFYPSAPCLNQIVIAIVQANNPSISGVHYDWRGTHTYFEQNLSGSEVHFTTLPRFPYTAYVYVKGTNTCGSSLEYSKLLTVKTCGGGIPPAPAVVINPNPASTEITVNIEYDMSQDLLTNSETSFNIENSDISVFNIHGNPVFKGKIHSESTRLNVSNWNKGLYLIKICDGKQTIEGTFIVE